MLGALWACIARRAIPLVVVIAGALIVALPGGALVANASGRDAIVVRNDRGGNVRQRIHQIDAYRRTGSKIEIRGRYCLSACTLYLGLRNTCVTPRTVFGFHGPSSSIYGVALPSGKFEHWSRQMAMQYPEPLRSWFIATGRYRLVGFYEYSGAQLIRMGIQKCTS